MRMHMQFSRWVGGSQPANVPILLGADGAPGVPPTGEPTNAEDNVLIAPFNNNNGWPSHRIAVSYLAPSGTLALTAQIWLWDELTKAWYEQGVPGVVTPNRIEYFDIVGLADPPPIARSSQQVGGSVVSSAGSHAAMLVVQAGAAPNGRHVFAMGPDLTVLPG